MICFNVIGLIKLGPVETSNFKIKNKLEERAYRILVFAPPSFNTRSVSLMYLFLSFYSPDDSLYYSFRVENTTSVPSLV